MKTVKFLAGVILCLMFTACGQYIENIADKVQPKIIVSEDDLGLDNIECTECPQPLKIKGIYAMNIDEYGWVLGIKLDGGCASVEQINTMEVYYRTPDGDGNWIREIMFNIDGIQPICFASENVLGWIDIDQPCMGKYWCEMATNLVYIEVLIKNNTDVYSQAFVHPGGTIP